MAISNDQLAEIGLNIESGRHTISDEFPPGQGDSETKNIGGGGKDLGDVTGNPNLKGYTLLETQYIKDIDGNYRVKSIAYMDADGNVYVHFTGTGDGNWDYNKAAYDSVPSTIQTNSSAFLAHIIETYRTGDSAVYVTGHSQGGNTAQYSTLTIDPKYGQYIVTTVSMDGPGFSKPVYNNELHQHGDEYYESQRQKMYAFNGHSDYVNPLGQVQIIPEEHKYMVKTGDDGYNADPDAGGPTKWHCGDYMLTDKGKLRDYLPYDEAIEAGWQSPVQKAVIAINSWMVENLPAEDQRFIAILIMAFAETFLGKDVKGDFLTVAYEAIRLYVPGAEPVIEQISIMVQEKGFSSWQDIWDYICEDPLKNTLELFSYVFGNKESLIGLMKMAGFIALLVKAIPFILTILAKVIVIIAAVAAIIAAIYLVIQIIKLVVDFLVEMWDAICNFVEATIEYATKLANDIYEYVKGKVEAAIDATVEFAKYLYDSAKKITKKIYDGVVSFVNTAKQKIVDTYNLIKQTAQKISNTICGFIQQGVTLQMALLQDCADRMNRIATRVNNIDTRLDTLYWQLCRSEIEQGEGIFTTLASLYNLARADLNVDEGNRIRRMANNLNNVNESYKAIEKWAMGLKLGG